MNNSPPLRERLLPTRYLPTLAHFGRCHQHLHRLSSRRSTEVALLWILVAMIARLLHALGLIPAPPVLAQNALFTRLAAAADAAYATLWPGAHFWVVALSVAVVLSLAGLHQSYAAYRLALERGNPAILMEAGEDDERYWQSVDVRWLMVDIRMRRAGMITAIGYFATLSWTLLIHAGLWSAVIFIALCGLCMYVDNRLYLTQKKHEERRDVRERAERDALRLMCFGPGADRATGTGGNGSSLH